MLQNEECVSVFNGWSPHPSPYTTQVAWAAANVTLKADLR